MTIGFIAFAVIGVVVVLAVVLAWSPNLAEVDGVDTYELGVADLTPEGHKGEFAGLLRAAADELEQEASQ